MPRWPRANGEVEQFMKPLTKIIQTAYIERRDWKEEYYNYLLAYRSTPHVTTGVAPSEMMFNRQVKHFIPEWQHKPEWTNQNIDQKDHDNKLKAKLYSDKRLQAKLSDITINDRVLVKQQKQNKLTPAFNPNPYIVTQKKEIWLQHITHSPNTILLEISHIIRRYHIMHHYHQ